MSIDQNLNVVQIPAPQDNEIARLGIELNKTYLPFGKMGQAGQARQSMQDANASNVSTAVLATRSISKSNSFYCNDAWDLVDAIKNGKCKLDDVKDEDLPDGLRKLDKTARKAKVDEAARQRGEIQAKILKLNQDREQFLDGKRKKLAGAKEDTLDKVIGKAIRDQAARHNFKFE